MRAITIQETALYVGNAASASALALPGASAGRDRPVGVCALTRIQVIDDGGVDGITDLTRYGLHKTDLVESWEVAESVDDPGVHATVRLASQAGWESPLPIASLAKPLSPGRRRRLVIESALAPPDHCRSDDNLLDDATIFAGDYASGGDRTASVHAFINLVSAAITRSTAQHFAGTGSVQVVTNAAAGSGLWLSPALSQAPRMPNHPYILSVWVRVSAGTQTLALSIDDGAGGSVTTSATVGTAWTKLSVTGRSEANGTLTGSLTNGAGGAFTFCADAFSLVLDDRLTWRRIFEGYIDTVSWNWREQSATIDCRDRSAELQDTFIEEERQYGSAGGWTVQSVMQSIIDDNFGLVWSTPLTPAVGSYIRPTVYNGFAYICTVSGAVAGAEPTWPTTIDSTVVDGGATWVCATRYPVLYTPVAPAPAWLIRTYKQQRMPVLEALQTLAQQIGWDVRFRWDATTSVWRLTFWEADRAAVVEDHAFTTDWYHVLREVTSERRSIENIRNAVRVLYTAEDGTGTRGVMEALDTTSMAQGLGRRFAEFAEASASNIGASAEAQLMADAAVADMAQVRTEVELELAFWPCVEVTDLYLFADPGGWTFASELYATPLGIFTLAANGMLSVLGYTHRGAPGLTTTSLQLREAQVTGAVAKWLQREVRPGNAPAAPAMSDALASWLQAWRGAAQAIVPGVLTVVLFDTEGLDSSAAYAPASGQWTCPRTGVWSVESKVTLLALAAGVLMQVGVYVGGALVYAEQITTGAIGNQALKVSILGLHLDGGDVVDVRVQHNDGVNRNISGAQADSWITIGRQR